jgi:hypothetical protein
MPEHIRTRIKALSVRGYRSLRQLELVDLPELIVLFGPNGSGKSNILGAARLALRAAVCAGSRLPWEEEQPGVLSLEEANTELELRPDDFAHGEPPEIRVAMEVALGTRAREVALPPRRMSFGSLFLDVVFQDPGDKTIRYWFKRADVDGEPLASGVALKPDVLQVGPEALAAQRLQKLLLPKLLRVSPAYRTPTDLGNPTAALYDAFLSEDLREQAAAKALGRQLADAGLFGRDSAPVELSPVGSKTFGEKQIRVSHPTHGSLSLRNLGTGEQQIVFMLGQRVITPFPIAVLEEPEAHLHVSLMQPLARVLRRSVDGTESMAPAVDQLWMATHHHCFAIASTYFDVAMVDGWTTVTQLPRAKAAQHHWEPGPIWEALRQLAGSAKERDAVVFRDGTGSAVTAGQVLESIEQDPEQRVAGEYARGMTEAIVLQMRRRAETPR